MEIGLHDSPGEADVAGHGPAMSVVVPLFNKAPYVAETLHSVLAQRNRNFELIVVDDGSTDDGAAIVAALTDPRVRLLRQDNAGVAAARNKGLCAASHDWVAFLDADDHWGVDHLAELAGMARTHPDAGMVATDILEVRGSDARDPMSALSAEKGVPRQIDYFLAAAANGRVVTSSSVALNRERALSIGGFRDFRPGEDIDCWVRMALHWPVVVSPQATACYRQDTNGAMDAWARRPVGGRSRRIASIQAFGGTIEMLSDLLDSGQCGGRRASIERFVDARILSNAGRSLSWGDARGARERLAFVRDRTTRAFRDMRLLTLLPGPILRLGVRLRRQVRNR